MMSPHRWPAAAVALVVAATGLAGCSAKPNDVDRQRIATMKADQIFRDNPSVTIREGFFHGPNLVSGEPPGNDTTAGAAPLTPPDVYRRAAALLAILRGEGWVVLYTACKPQFVDYPPRDDTPLVPPDLAARGYRTIDGVSYVFVMDAKGAENRFQSWVQLAAPFHEDVTNSFPDAPPGLTPEQTCIEAADPAARTPRTDGTIRDLVLSTSG